jgi:hypothetical protein
MAFSCFRLESFAMFERRGTIKLWLPVNYVHSYDVVAESHEVQENKSGGFMGWLTFFYSFFRWEKYGLQTQVISSLAFKLLPIIAVVKTFRPS